MIRIFDNVLSDAMAYRNAALASEFGDVTLGPDTFCGIGGCPSSEVADFLLEQGLSAKVQFLRKSGEGQLEPNYIHSDSEMGSWTGIYYMNPKPPAGDGTTFWRLDQTGAEGGAWTPEIAKAAKSLKGWSPVQHVEGRFNRLLVFPSDLFHSRSIYENYGRGENARLIEVLFG